MNELEVWQGTPPPYWDELVRRCNGTVFHSSLWAEYQSQIQNASPVFFLLKPVAGDGGVGSVGLLRKSHVPVVSSCVRDIVLLSHPFQEKTNGRLIQEFFDRCEILGKEWGCSRLSIESFYCGRSPFRPREHGYKESRRVEFVLDLNRESKSLWQGMKKDQRERIRRLEREGVNIVEGKDLDDLRDLKLVRETTQVRRAQKGQNYSLASGEKGYEQLDFHVLKRGIGRVFMAKRGDEIIAAIFYATFNRKAYSVFSGSTQIGYRLGAQSGLFWAAVTQFQKEGYTELNRGGVPENAQREDDPLHGIYQFKNRLGTTPLTCRSGTKILNPFKEQASRIWERVRALRYAIK